MQETEANLKRAAIEFLEAAGAAADEAGRAVESDDPLDQVDVEIFDLGPFEPVLDADDLTELKQRLSRERLLPATLLELVGLARQVATTLLEG